MMSIQIQLDRVGPRFVQRVTRKAVALFAVGLALFVLTPDKAAVAQSDLGSVVIYGTSNNSRNQPVISTFRIRTFGFSGFFQTTRLVESRQSRVSGLQPGETLLGIDIRPATGQLYALGSSSRLYVLDPRSGQATAIGGTFVIPLQGTSFGFDFNPTVDRIRVVSDADQNLRLNPDTGAVVDFNMNLPGIQPDGNLFFAGGTPNPNVIGSAYTNNDNDPTTGTTLFGIDSVQNLLVTQGSTNPPVSPNSGQLFSRGFLGVDASTPLGFDILTDGSTNTGFATFLTPFQSFTQLYNINLATGNATFIGSTGTRILTGLAVTQESTGFIDFQ